jgi:hypothetical protein
MPFNFIILEDRETIVDEDWWMGRFKVCAEVWWWLKKKKKIVKILITKINKFSFTFCMSTVVTLRLIVFSSAKRYKSIKYSWQNRQAPFRRPSIVEA